MPLTMRQILLRTPRSRRDAADYCKVKEIKAITKKSTGQVTFKAKTLSTHTPAGEKKPVWNTYVSTIEVKQRNTVLVDCSCDDFWAVWEYALNKQGAANIGHSNGQPPNEKNPSMRPGCCKHLVAMSRKLIERNKL